MDGNFVHRSRLLAPELNEGELQREGARKCVSVNINDAVLIVLTLRKNKRPLRTRKLQTKILTGNDAREMRDMTSDSRLHPSWSCAVDARFRYVFVVQSKIKIHSIF